MPRNAPVAPDRALSRPIRGAFALPLLLAGLAAQRPAALPPALESYAAHLAAAEGAMVRDATGEVWRWLDAVPPADRCFAWHVLAGEADRSLVAHALHAEGLTSLAVSPDGATCAVGTVDGTILLVATADCVDPSRQGALQPVRTIAAHQHRIYCLAFDGDGKRLASSSADRGAAIWDVSTGAKLATFANHTYPVGSIRFAPDGKRMCSSSYQRPKGGEIRIWDANDGTELAVLQSGYAPMTCSHWSPDGTHIVGASWDQQLHVFDLAAPEKPIVVRLGADGGYRAAQASALSPDGKLVAVACKDDLVHLFDAWTGAQVRDFAGHTKIVEGVAFSPDGTMLASVAADTTVRLWQVATGTQLAVLRGHRGLVRGVAFTADGTRLLTGSADGTLRAWHVPLALVQRNPVELPQSAYCVAERPDGAAVALGDATGRLELRPRNGEAPVELAHDDEWIASLHWSRAADGTWQLLAAGRRHLQLWDPAAKTRRTFADPNATAPGHGCGGGIDAAALAADGRTIAAVSRDNKARLWDVATGRMLWAIDFPKTPTRLAFAPDGSTIGICGQAGAGLHDPATGALRTPLTGHRGTVTALCFTPDGAQVLTLGEDSTLRIWRTADGAPLASVTAHDGPARTGAISPDGSRFATCGDDNRLVLWDVATRAPVWSRELADGFRLAWSHDGTRLWATTLDKKLFCFDAKPAR